MGKEYGKNKPAQYLRGDSQAGVEIFFKAEVEEGRPDEQSLGKQ